MGNGNVSSRCRIWLQVVAKESLLLLTKGHMALFATSTIVTAHKCGLCYGRSGVGTMPASCPTSLPSRVPLPLRDYRRGKTLNIIPRPHYARYWVMEESGMRSVKNAGHHSHAPELLFLLSLTFEVLVVQPIQRFVIGTFMALAVAGVQVLGGGVDAVVAGIGLHM